jgi:integrase
MPYKDRGKWRAVVRMNGLRTSESFPLTKQGFRDAAAWESAEKERRKSEKTETGTDFGSLYNEYLDYCQVRYSASTYSEKRTLGRRFLRFLNGVGPDDPGLNLLSFEISSVTAKHIQDFMMLRAEAKSKNNANVARKNLHSFWEWAGKVHGIQPNPVSIMDKFPHQRKAQYVPMEADILKVLMSCDRKERAFLNCYLQTAARRSSVFRWKWGEDVDFHLKQVRIGSRKTADGSMQYIWLPMTKELHEDLQWWRVNRQHRDSPYVWTVSEGPYEGQPFTYRHKFLKGLCKRAGVREIHFHDLRRYAATKLAASGVSMTLIQRILGHKALSTTERYLGRVNEDLRSTMELLGHDKGDKVPRASTTLVVTGPRSE